MPGPNGYVLVGAAMRQLLSEGWVPGRARLLASSFLTKDLGIDWRSGEQWFIQRQAGCVIGRDYPRPIVDHAAARRAALARFATRR